MRGDKEKTVEPSRRPIGREASDSNDDEEEEREAEAGDQRFEFGSHDLEDDRSNVVVVVVEEAVARQESLLRREREFYFCT